jgi:hypothetical protein
MVFSEIFAVSLEVSLKMNYKDIKSIDEIYTDFPYYGRGRMKKH